MLASYFNPTVIAEWFTFFASLILFKRDDYWKMFIPFLFITLVAETAGWYLRFMLKISSNNWIFNLLLLVSLAFISWIFSKADQFNKGRKLIQTTSIVLLCCASLNLFFIQGFWTYNTYTEVVKDIFWTVLSGYFFFIILSEERQVDLFKYEYFWLATGLLFNCLGNVVFYLFLDVLREFYRETSINLMMIINSVLNILLYISLIIAFICRMKSIK